MDICLKLKCNVFGYYRFARTFSRKLAVADNYTMKILNVAEKNDAAKNIAGFLSGGNSHRVREKFSLTFIILSVSQSLNLYFSFREKDYRNTIKFTNSITIFAVRMPEW